MNGNQSIARLGDNSQRLAVEHVPIHQLKRNARNPRDHKEKQLAKPPESIDRFGFVVPCIIDDDYRVLADAVCARTGVTFAARAAAARTKPTDPSPRGQETNHG